MDPFGLLPIEILDIILEFIENTSIKQNDKELLFDTYDILLGVSKSTRTTIGVPFLKRIYKLCGDDSFIFMNYVIKFGESRISNFINSTRGSGIINLNYDKHITDAPFKTGMFFGMLHVDPYTVIDQNTFIFACRLCYMSRINNYANIEFIKNLHDKVFKINYNCLLEAAVYSDSPNVILFMIDEGYIGINYAKEYIMRRDNAFCLSMLIKANEFIVSYEDIGNAIYMNAIKCKDILQLEMND
ncbi:hypothetical protein E24_00224 [Faustovirus]|nr:hypothetical protein PRJ_Fausto_00210 [Faustovirus]AMN83152.1 hypothetical protein E24_00224 [Faustovirus]AMN84132.1 hypothetical protein D5a_00222 [Faustovirus]AMN85121.1 hypothetical protein E23_00223 [Faustovirus]QBR99117.1 hypothetical protein [Faustovirus mariensis]